MFPEALAALGAHTAIFGTLPLNQGLPIAPIFNELIFGELPTARKAIWHAVFYGAVWNLPHMDCRDYFAAS